jgi:periplasmic protein TonB
MFTNLIESDTHRKEFKRRSSFFLATVAAYALILFAAGIASIYAYDAHLDAQNTDLTLLSWVPPVKPVPDRVRPQPVRHTAANNTGRVSPQPVRPVLYESASNPHTTPSAVSVMAQPIPPAPPNAVIGRGISDPLSPPGGSSCVSCTGNSTGPVVKVPDTTPPPAPVAVKPPTQRVTSVVLTSKAISLPQPAYPQLAKQIHIGGPVVIQILVDEQGKVVSAQVLSGHPTLVGAAREAALRARFTPTLLNGQAAKVQGVITYNFVLQ